MDWMQNPILQVIKAKYTSLEPVLDERARRLWAGAEARAIGRGGITRVAQAIGLSRVTVRAGLKELDLPITPAAGRETLRRLRRVGGGRKHLVDHDVDLLRDLEILVDPVTRGDPMSPLQWTCKSAAKLAAELQARGHAVRSLAKIDCPIRGQECYNGLDAEPYSTGHQSEIHQP